MVESDDLLPLNKLASFNEMTNIFNSFRELYKYELLIASIWNASNLVTCFEFLFFCLGLKFWNLLQFLPLSYTNLYSQYFYLGVKLEMSFQSLCFTINNVALLPLSLIKNLISKKSSQAWLHNRMPWLSNSCWVE